MASLETGSSTITTLPPTKTLVVAKYHTTHTAYWSTQYNKVNKVMCFALLIFLVFMDVWTCGVHKTRPIPYTTSCRSTQVIVSNTGVWTKHCHKHTIYTRRHHFNTGLLHCRHCNIGYRDTMGTRTIFINFTLHSSQSQLTPAKVGSWLTQASTWVTYLYTALPDIETYTISTHTNIQIWHSLGV